MKTRATLRSASPRSSAGRASRIRLLVLDVDGVLTDGILVYGASGEEIKRFHVRDGLAMQAARRAGLEVAVISGRASAAVTRRMSELGIVEVHQGVADLPLMRIAGLAMSPADAVPEVRRAAGWVSRWVGGHGAVREAVELLLRSRKSWPPLK